ncbi:MAG: hypothetical protein IT379_19945 [Deltaproteobacteria bacterium]|nr:hypothetical protein [Deltaproteobacteria bacterium]
MTRAAAWWLTLSVLGAGACGDDDGGAPRDDAGAPDASTLDAASPPPAPTVTIRGALADLLGATPFEPIEVCVHERPDIPCVHTDDEGAYALAGVPADSDIALTLRDGANAYQPELLPLHTPAVDITFSPRILETELVGQLEDRAGVSLDPARSVVLFYASAGPSGGLPGVSAELVPDDAEALAYVTSSLSVSTTATETTMAGMGLFLDVPEGEHRLRFSYEGRACAATPGSWEGDEPGELRAPSVAGYWVVVGQSGCATP